MIKEKIITVKVSERKDISLELLSKLLEEELKFQVEA